MNLFIDLDGTLLDSKKRLFILFNDLVTESTLSFDEYWTRKFRGLNHKNILMNEFYYSESMYEDFERRWLSLIEEKHYLKFDVPFLGIANWLEKMKSAYKLYLVTARQTCNSVDWQLDRYNLKHFFDEVLVTQQVKTKEELIKSSTIVLTGKDWLIGDTGYDVLTAKSLGINSLSVCSGFMTGNNLRKYNPDLVLESIVEFK